HLGLSGDTAYHPIFQSALAWQPGAPPAPVSEATTDFALDLAISMRDVDGILSGEFTFADALFDRATGERHLGHWLNLLGAAAGNDDGPIDHLPLLDADGMRAIVERWND